MNAKLKTILKRLIAEQKKHVRNHTEGDVTEKVFDYYSYTQACANICMEYTTNSDGDYIILRDMAMEQTDEKFYAANQKATGFKFLGYPMVD